MTTDELRAKFENYKTGMRLRGYVLSELDWIVYQDSHKAAHASRDAEVEAMKRDVERFDWMVFHGAKVYWGSDSEVCHVEWFDEAEEELQNTGNYFDEREAIDAAMREGK